jgi:hypothetical protein
MLCFDGFNKKEIYKHNRMRPLKLIISKKNIYYIESVIICGICNAVDCVLCFMCIILSRVRGSGLDGWIY